jgi:hypothetical protein
MSRSLQDFLSPELFSFLLPDQRDDILDSFRLLDHFSTPDKNGMQDPQDFAFIVFPTARAFEGFLKYFFMHIGVLGDEHYRSKHFRVGRSFNPDIKMHLRDEVWIYDDVARATSDEIARELWQMWLSGRNHLFHYFPDDRYQVSYAQAKDLVEGLIKAMDDAVRSGEK